MAGELSFASGTVSYEFSSERKNGSLCYVTRFLFNVPKSFWNLTGDSAPILPVSFQNDLSIFPSYTQLSNGGKSVGNALVAKRTTQGASMGCPFHLWVAIGDRATVFGQHWNLWNDIFLNFTYVNCIHVFKSRYKGILLENILMEGNMAFIHDTNSVSMWTNISTFPYSRITKMYAQFGGIRIFLKRALRIVVYCAIGNVDKTIYGYGIHKSRWNSHADCYHY